jgi:small conductance mechanosensitive channel
MNNLYDLITSKYLHYIYLPIIYIVIGIIIYLILERIVSRIFDIRLNYIKIRNRRKKTLESITENILKYAIAIIVILATLSVFNINTKALLTGLGIFGLVFGLAFQDIIKDFLSGIFIIFENQYDVGDVISINNYRGEVIFLGLRTTRIKNIDGDIKIFLNRNITEVINYSLSHSRVLIDISVGIEEDVDKVEKELENIFRNMNNEIEYLIGDIMLLGVNKVDILSTTFRMVAQCKPLKFPDVQRQILKRLKIELDKRKIKTVSLIGGLL